MRETLMNLEWETGFSDDESSKEAMKKEQGEAELQETCASI